MPEDDGYEIVKTLEVVDSLEKKTMHLMRLKNGMMRIVVITKKRDGIDEHSLFEVSAEDLNNLLT